jgi:hypothetical protein
MKYLAAFGVCAVLLVPVSALAGGGDKPAKPADKTEPARSSGPVRAKDFVFEGDEVDGVRVRGDDDDIAALPHAARTGLIRVRTDFVREILESAESL